MEMLNLDLFPLCGTSILLRRRIIGGGINPWVLSVFKPALPPPTGENPCAALGCLPILNPYTGTHLPTWGCLCFFLITSIIITKMFARLEESTGLVIRFIIGTTGDKAKMSQLMKEVAQYDDFILLDIQEEYSKLPYKTLVRAYNYFISLSCLHNHPILIPTSCTFISGCPSLKLPMHFMILNSMSKLMTTFI